MKNKLLHFMHMDIQTHKQAHSPLLGTPLEIITGEKAVVRLVAIQNMVVDDHGLVHGGFTFGLADYAAMLAVNDPNVVISGAEVTFTAPVKNGDVLTAEAVVCSVEKRKRIVKVEVSVSDKTVFTGELTCYILDRHVLDR